MLVKKVDYVVAGSFSRVYPLEIMATSMTYKWIEAKILQIWIFEK